MPSIIHPIINEFPWSSVENNFHPAFMDQEVQNVCERIDDYQISIDRDMPQDLWDTFKKEGFMGMIIPKSYGGKGFSAHGHSQVVQKISSCSSNVSGTIAVPNSLGPGMIYRNLYDCAQLHRNLSQSFPSLSWRYWVASSTDISQLSQPQVSCWFATVQKNKKNTSYPVLPPVSWSHASDWPRLTPDQTLPRWARRMGRLWRETGS